MNTMFDLYGSEAEASYRRQQVTRQYRKANAGRSNHPSPLRRWREARGHHAG